MRWMEIAWAQVGVAETAGPQATPEIVAMFRDAGRPDVTSDEIAWCGACVGACLSRGGIRLTVPPERRLLARAYLEQGQPLSEPRLEAIVVLKRPEGGPTAGHVGFVTGWDTERVHVLGGNQANQVCVKSFPREDVLGYRWPAPAATPADLDKAGSRITTLAARQQKDGAKVATVPPGGGLVAEAAPPLPSPEALAGKASGLQGALETGLSFAQFAGRHWWLIGLALAAYWGARMLWTGWLIRQARTADHNSGANTARAALASPAVEETLA